MLETFVTKGTLLAFTPISKNIQIKIIKIGVKYLPSISITEVDLKENKNTKIKYIIEKITNAPSKIVSDLIYRYFDLNDGKASHLDLFNDINEYQAYIENITDQMAENEELVISNIMLVLEKVSFTDDRSELIKKTMIYSQKKELLPESLNACFEKLFHIELTPYFSEILLLLLKGFAYLQILYFTILR